MPKAKKRRKGSARLNLDPDWVGLFAGVTCGTVVMAWCFYTGQVHFLNVVLRVLITFGIAYVAASLFATIARQIYESERETARAAARAEAAKQAEETPETADGQGESP